MARPRIQRDPLTVGGVKKATAGEADRFLWDGVEHGLALKVTPTGMKVFILQKAVRKALGKRVTRITLGKFPDMTLDAARVMARKLNGIIAEGRDPVAEKDAGEEAEQRRVRLEKTMQDLWRRYEDEVIAQNKPRTQDEKRRMWERRINPTLGKLKVKDVTGTDASEVVRLPLKGSGAGKGEAGNLYRLLRHMFYKAILWGMRPRELGNPLKEVDQPKVEARQLKIGERAIGALLKAIDDSAAGRQEPKQVTGVLKSAVLTGARISELLTLQWDNVHKDEGELRWEDTKTGPSERPISADVMKLILSMRTVALGSPYVFPALSDPQKPLPYSTVRHAFERICAKAGVKNCTLHTLRHFFATETAKNVNNHKIGMQLTGHRSLTAYMGYVHAEKEQAHALVKDQLAPLFKRVAAASSNVVSVKRKARV